MKVANDQKNKPGAFPSPNPAHSRRISRAKKRGITDRRAGSALAFLLPMMITGDLQLKAHCQFHWEIANPTTARGRTQKETKMIQY